MTFRHPGRPQADPGPRAGALQNPLGTRPPTPAPPHGGGPTRAPGPAHCRPPWVPALRFAPAGMTIEIEANEQPCRSLEEDYASTDLRPVAVSSKPRPRGAGRRHKRSRPIRRAPVEGRLGPSGRVE